jgi:hypothetical protein
MSHRDMQSLMDRELQGVGIIVKNRVILEKVD